MDWRQLTSLQKESLVVSLMNTVSLKKLKLKKHRRTDNLSVLLTVFIALLMPAVGILSQAVQVNSSWQQTLRTFLFPQTCLLSAGCSHVAVACSLLLSSYGTGQEHTTDMSQLPTPCDRVWSPAPGDHSSPCHGNNGLTLCSFKSRLISFVQRHTGRGAVHCLTQMTVWLEASIWGKNKTKW